MDILPVFCDIDDFCQFFEPAWKRQHVAGTGSANATASSLSSLGSDDDYCVVPRFKLPKLQAYYTEQVCPHLGWAFPRLGYNRFVELMPSALVPLCCYYRPDKERAAASRSLTRPV